MRKPINFDKLHGIKFSDILGNRKFHSVTKNYNGNNIGILINYVTIYDISKTIYPTNNDSLILLVNKGYSDNHKEVIVYIDWKNRQYVYNTIYGGAYNREVTDKINFKFLDTITNDPMHWIKMSDRDVSSVDEFVSMLITMYTKMIVNNEV